MNQVLTASLRNQLQQRRSNLESAIARVTDADDLVRLLVEVDQALERLDTSDYGRCLVCKDMMDDEEMQENPMRQYCLCDLNEHATAELQRDLDLAWQVQASLLPPQDLEHAGWQAHYRYRPAGAVSGDYCDVITHQSATDPWMYFLAGDVTGKGVAASAVMAQVSALVRSTLDAAVPVDYLMETVNRHLADRSLGTHFVTLVAGRAHPSGRVELSNAGHCRPVILGGQSWQELDPTGIPVGITDETDYTVHVADLESGDSIVLYTDGVSEAQNGVGQLYGSERLAQTAAAHRHETPARLAAACLQDVNDYCDPTAARDDLTLLVLRYQ